MNAITDADTAGQGHTRSEMDMVTDTCNHGPRKRGVLTIVFLPILLPVWITPRP